MKLSELIALVGDESVQFQTLKGSYCHAQNARSGATITFFTDATKVAQIMTQVLTGAKPEFTGFVVWLPTSKLEDALTRDEQEHLSNELLESLNEGRCPDCGGVGFLKGPEAGLCTNIMCNSCGSRFNYCPPCAMMSTGFAERIGGATQERPCSKEPVPNPAAESKAQLPEKQC